MSRKRKIWVVVSLVAALLVLIPLGLRWRAQWNLNAYRKKLIASGEKLTVEELAPERDLHATNTALFLRLVSTIQPFWQFHPTLMLSVKPGVARVAWLQARLIETFDPSKPTTNIWPALAEAVRTNEQTLDELRTMVDAGGIEFIEDYNPANLNNYTYLIKVKESVQDLTARAMLALHQGRRREALSYLESCGTATQLTAKDPIMIDQMIRYACMSLEAEACWEALQTGGWTDGELAQLQHQWDHSDVLAAAALSLAMERARAPTAFQAARASRQGLEDLLGGDSDLKNFSAIWNDFLLHASSVPNELLTTYPRYWGWRWIWSYRDEQSYLEFMQTVIGATRDAQQRRSIISLLQDRSETPTFYPPVGKHFDVAGSMARGTERYVSLALRAQTVANMVTAAIALERFRLAHHAYPAALTNLAPEFVQTVPVDCMDGHDLRYRLNPDGTYLLYSVGRDGIDNGGDPTPEKGKSLSFFNGQDLVWPRPATEEEVQTYETEQNKQKAGKRQ